MFSRTHAGTALNYIIAEIGGCDLTASMQSIAQLEVVMRSTSQGEIVKHVDQVCLNVYLSHEYITIML